MVEKINWCPKKKWHLKEGEREIKIGWRHILKLKKNLNRLGYLQINKIFFHQLIVCILDRRRIGFYRYVRVADPLQCNVVCAHFMLQTLTEAAVRMRLIIHSHDRIKLRENGKLNYVSEYFHLTWLAWLKL